MSLNIVRLATRFAIPCTILFLSLVSAAGARDDSVEAVVRNLAKRIAAELPRAKAGCVNWNNHSAVSEERSQQMKSAFLDELQGKQNAAAPAAAGSCAVSVTMERTPSQIVMTAGMENGEKQYWIASIPRAGLPAENEGASVPRLEKELLWQQSERILDALFIRGTNGDADRLAILTKDALTVHQKQSGAWKLLHTNPLGEAETAQRAPIGALYFSPDQPDKLKIVIGGKSCQTTFGEGASLACTQTTEAPRTGVLLASNCDARVWWLRSDGGDMTETDRLELLTPSSLQTQAPVAELSMPGPIVSISSGEALHADTAVVFHLATGNYEVFRITLACGL
ncbi:MAG TPA: hypothetical protein VKT53_06015 [Candidatus Acidoferrum sp.]|nr:hypothetical protein [Candidatus Acidoferrum sp.]